MPNDWVNPNKVRREQVARENAQIKRERDRQAEIEKGARQGWINPNLYTPRERMDRYLESKGLLNYQRPQQSMGGIDAPHLVPTGGNADRPQNFMQGTDPVTGKAVVIPSQKITNAQSPYAPMVFAKPEQVQKGEANWTDLSTTDRAAILKNPDFYKNNEILKYTPAQQQEILADTNLDWKQLPKWQQAFYSFSSNPYLMSTTQGAIMGAGGGTKGVVFGGVLGALGVASKYDPTKEFYKQGDENNKMDAGDFIRGAFGLLNFAAEQAEKGIGVVVRGAQIVTGNDPNFDPNKRNLDIQFNNEFNLDIKLNKNFSLSKENFDPFLLGLGENFNPELLTGSTWNAGASTFEAIAPSFTQMMAGDKTMQVSLLTPIVGIFDMFTNPEKYKGTEYYLGAAQAEQMQTTFYERLNEAEQRIKNGENYRQVATDMQTGIIAQLGDMVGQGVADPLNIAGEAQAAAGYGIAKITDNKIAAAAFADANGLMEAQARYKNIINTPGEALKIDPNYKVQELGALGKMVAGLNKDGQVKAGAFTQQGLLDYTAPKKNLRGAIEYLTNLNPESRARVGQDLLLSNVGRIMSSYFGGTDVEGFANWWKAFSQGDMTQAADLSNAMAQSPEFYTVLPAAKDFDIDAAVTKWKASDDARQSVTRIADILGENPTSMLEDMAKRGTSQQDFTRLQERLTQAGTPEAKALLKDIQQGKFTVDMLADTVKLFSSGDVPYHPAQWMAQTLNGIKDHYDNWAVQHFNLDAESKKTLFRVSSVLKSAQSVLLLGANPGYMISNVLPTMVTRAMSGVWGYMTPSAIDGTLTRMGFDPKQGFNPNRLDEGVGPGGMVDRTGGDPIREATRGKGILTKLENALGTIGRNMPFNKLSRLLEGYEGKQAGMIGMMKFWGEAWRRGKGFRELPRGLAQELAKIAGPRATEILYSAIEAGMNKQEILNIVSSAERNIQSRSLINEAAQKMNLPASKAASLLEQAGVFDALDNSLKNAKTDAQIDRAFERAKQTARVELDQQAARDAVANIEHIANRMNTEGMKAITDVILDTEDAGIEQWMQHYQRMGEAADAMDVIDNPNTRSSLWSLKYAESNAEFRRHNAHKGSVYLGVLKALGQDTNPTGRALLANMAGTDAALDTAYRTMRSLRDEHFAKWNNDWDNPRRQVERTNVERQIEKTWAEATKTELENSRQFGELLAQQYEQAFGIEAGEAARQAWEQISAFRKEMTDRRDAFRKTQESARDAGVPYTQRQMEAKKFWGETYKYMIVEMQRIKTEAIRKLDNIANQRPGDNQATAPTEPTPPTTPPVTPAAQDFLNSATQEGAMPAFITNNLRKIASDNGITITDQMTAADVVQALQEKANNQPAETAQPTTPAPDELARLRQQAEERKAIKEAQTQAVWSAAEKYGFTQQEKHKLITSLNKYGDFEVLTYDDPRITPEYVDQTLQKRQEAKAQEQARKEQNAADKAVSQVQRDAIEKPRSEIPETISNALALEAQRIADVIAGGEPGKRLFARTGEFIGASASTYPKWYGELQATTGGRKSLLKALDKIVKDNGADKGVVVARVKEFLLGNLRYGDDATNMPPNLVVLKDLGADDTVLNFALDEFNTMMRTNFTMEQVLGNDYSSAFDGYYNDAMTPGAFDTDAWHVAVLEAADARDMAKLNDLYEQMPADGWDEIANASGDTYRQFYDERFEATSELIRTSQQEAAILDNQVRAEAAVREQQAEAELGFTRAKFRESLTEVFGLEETMANAVMDITDARANAYGDAAEWYRTRIADVQKAGGFDLAQEAYHGSPYKFDKFTLDKIGAGEGAQAYGWGLYFAGDKAVAEWYREVLSNDWTYNGKSSESYKGSGIHSILDSVAKSGDISIVERTIKNLNNKIESAVYHAENPLSIISQSKHRMNGEEWVEYQASVDGEYKNSRNKSEVLEWIKDKSKTEVESITRKIDELSKIRVEDFQVNKGQLYKVEIPDENYLLWDEPLSEQPESVQNIVNSLLPEYKNEKNITGEDVYRMLISTDGSDKAASIALKEAGINGIQYLDGSSRGKGEGNYNYVIFDDAAIDILETYYQADTSQDMFGSGMLPGMNEPMGAGDQGQLFGIQPGAGGKLSKMDAGDARSVYDLDPNRTVKDTAGNELKRGDIVEESTGVRHNVVGVNMKGSIVTSEGKLIKPDSVTRVASQPDMFGATQQPRTFSPKGGVKFLDDGRAIIRAFNGKADVSTIVHELGHIFRRDLQGADLRTVETWAGVNGGKWDVAAEEKFARGFEKYLADGSAPTPKLRVVFEQFKGWMLNIYRAITGSPIDIDLTPQVKEVFDRLLIGQEQTRKIDTNEMLLQQGYDPKAYYQDPQGNIKRRGEINIKLDQSRRAQEADAILSSDFAKKLQEQKRTTPAGETKDPNVSPRKAPTHQLAYGEYIANAFAEQQKIAQNQLDTLSKIEAGELPQDAMPELMRDKLVKVKSDSGVTRYKSKPVTIEDVRAKYEEMLTRNTLSYEMYGDMREKWTAAVEQALKDDTPVSNAIKQEYYAMKKTSGERMQGAGQSVNELFQMGNSRRNLPDDRNLIAVHNLSAANLIHSEGLGGIAMPSLAILRKDINFDNFGEITLLADKRMIDPGSRDNVVANADIYTPRYPQFTSKINQAAAYDYFDAAYQDLIADFPNSKDYYGYKSEAVISDLKDNGTVENSALVAHSFMRRNGIPFPDTAKSPQDLLYYVRENHYDDFLSFAENLADKVTVERRISKGFTNSGNRRYAPYTLDNIVKDMKSRMKEGEGFNYGAGTIRSKVAKKFRSIEAIRKAQGDIIPRETAEAMKTEFNNRLVELAEAARPEKDAKSYGFLDRFSNILIEAVETRQDISRVFAQYEINISQDMAMDIMQYLNDLRDAPTEYFEAKVKRAVGLDEFATAVIPADAGQRIRDILNRNGIRYIEYDPNVKGSRQAAVEQAATEGDLLFQDADPRLFPDADPRMPLGGYEETAGWMPSSRAMDEVWSQDIAPLMDNMRDIAKQRLSEPTLDGAYRDMTPEAQRELMNYLKGVQSDMASTKMAASRWGEDRRDYAMLNYNKRTGFDQMLDVAFPYQFFYTRSMMTWAARAVDNPAILANYARIRRQQDRYENNLPERLRGKMRIEAPWMPDWMGDALYIDPLSVLFTPHSFLRPFEQMARDNNQQNVEAERILQEWAADGVIPENQIVEAAQTRSGKTWERALAEAKMRRESQISNPMDFVSATFGPAWYLTTPAKLLGLSKDGPETLTELPITRTARAVDTVTNNTWAEPIGNLIGLFAKPEEALRKKLNLPEFGEYGAYYVDRQLANMVAEGKITSEEATILMIERQGPVFDDARERVKMELAMRVPLMGATYAALNEGAGAGLKALPASLFGAAILPEGELKYRGLKQEWNDAWKLKDAGDDQAITRFFEEHPEYEAYLAKGKEPEERLKSFLVGQIWDGYMALGTTDRKQATAEMGKEFQQSFLDTETRSYDTLNIETLTQWAQMLNKRVPKTEQTLPAIENPRKINFLSSEVTSITDQYYEQRKRMYPDYYDLEQGYYNLPKSERRSYLVANPNLKEYWDWKRSWYDRYPDLVPVFKGEVFRQVDTSTWNPALVEFVADYAYSGAPLPAGAYKALTQVWINEGQPRGSLDDWLKQDVAPSLLYGN